MEEGIHDLVRDLHDEAALDPNLAVASVRPSGTTRLELRLMARDVSRKLEVDGSASVLEIGCGVGVIGLPLARRVGRYVGVDMAETALAVFRRRLAQSGLDDTRVDLVPLDFSAAPDEAVEPLGRFDRVLAYAVLHYVATEADGRTFVARALAALEPGGIALFGNLPIADLAAEMEAHPTRSQRLVRRVASVLGAALEPGTPNAVGVVESRGARLAALTVEGSRLLLRPVIKGARTAPTSLPPGSTVDLSRHVVEGWVESAPVAARYRWLPPGVATPLARGRADLLVYRDA